MSTSLQAGTLLQRRYRIVRLLGHGNFGRVYQARDQRAGKSPRFVAIKQMPLQMIVDCERQADLRTNLIHPAIPQVFGYFATDSHSYLVKQFIRGATLEVILRQESDFLAEKSVISWAIQLCDVLDFLHNHPHHPVIFRDLKPSNIMIDRADQVHLVDFELARAFPPGFFENQQPHYKHLRKGMAFGTKGYSPPEQYRGLVRPESDIYALGATLHYLLTAQDPRKERPFTLQNHPIHTINPAVSPDLESIVMKALNLDMKERYTTAKEMQVALRRLVA
jgi:serine/threonine protein kinase